LRIFGIVLMSLTALFTMMGGAGTSCVALDPAGFGGRFAGITPFQWLYLIYVAVTLAIGVMGARGVVLLIRGRKNAYRYSLIALISGLAIGVIHIVTSRALRGGSMPVDIVVYTTILTLVVFLLFRIPRIWVGVNFEKPEGEGQIGRHAAAFALAACGILSLTIQFLMAPTHTISGVNYADAWHGTLTALGIGLIAASGASFVRTAGRARLGAAGLLPHPLR
jgi:hypothetical protein